MLKNLLLVASGGAVGSALRYLTSIWVGRCWPMATFPWATLAANVLGCLLIGLFTAKWPGHDSLRLLLVTGFCGGYTTFSTFSLESLSLWTQQQYGAAIVYSLLSIVLGAAAVWAGNYLAHAAG